MNRVKSCFFFSVYVCPLFVLEQLTRFDSIQLGVELVTHQLCHVTWGVGVGEGDSLNRTERLNGRS